MMRGYGLNIVGLVLSMHAVGMFAFAPLVGRLVDRIGYLPSLATGILVTWASLLLSGIAPYESYWLLGAGLFLLGLDGASASSRAVPCSFASSPAQVRPVVEGWADSAIWTMVMLGGISAGILMSSIGYGFLNLVAAGPALVILLTVFSIRRLRSNFSG